MSSKQKSTQATNSSSSGGSISTSTPFAPAADGINAGLGMASNWMSSPGAQATYGGQRVADLSAGTQQGMAGLLSNPGYGTAQDLFTRTAQGDFLGQANPYMQQLQDSVAESVMPGLNATFARSGMTGSTIHQNQLAKGLASAMAPHLFGAYETERNRQMQAAGALPGIYGQQARDALTAGAIQDQQSQNVINADMAAFNEARDRPLMVATQGLAPLMQAGSAFGTRAGETWGKQNSTTTNTQQQSPFQQIMGGAMMGLGALTGMPGLGMAGAMGGASMAPMTSASAGMMNAMSPYTNPFSTGGYGYQPAPGFVPQYGSVF